MEVGLGLGLDRSRHPVRQIAAPEPSLSLKGIAPAGVRVGYSLPLNWAPSTAERELFAANFDAAVPDNATKWNQIERNAEGLYEWAKADAFLADAASIGAAYKIWHLFGWHVSIPTWMQTKLANSAVTWADAQNDLKQMIDAAAAKYPSWPFQRVDPWGEIFDGGVNATAANQMNETVWYQKSGNDPTYWYENYLYCRAKFPSALLSLDDFGLEGGEDHEGTGLEQARWEKRKREWALLHIINALEAGVPIDVFGLQGHLNPRYAYDRQGIRQFVQDLTNLGLKVAITQHDVWVSQVPGHVDNSPELRQLAADRAEAFLRDVLTYSNCEEIIFWHAMTGRMKVIEDGAVTELHAAAMRALADALPAAQRTISMDRWFDLRGTIPPWFAITGSPLMHNTNGVRVNANSSLSLPWSALRWIDDASFSMSFFLRPDFQPASGTHLVLKPEASNDRIELKYVPGFGDNRLTVRAVVGGVETVAETAHPNELADVTFNRVAMRVDAGTVSLCVNGGPVVSASGTVPGIERVWFGANADGTSRGEARFSTMTFHKTPLGDAAMVAATS
jgi:GH35 family endo-1,4-beta-xylanase